VPPNQALQLSAHTLGGRELRVARTVSIGISALLLTLACASSKPDLASSSPLSLSDSNSTLYGRWGGYDCDHGGSVFQPDGTEEILFIEDRIDAFSDFLRIDPDGGCEVGCLDVSLEGKRIGPGRYGAWGFATYKLVVAKVLSAKPARRNIYSCFDGI
jgi:hypothetical protein